MSEVSAQPPRGVLLRQYLRHPADFVRFITAQRLHDFAVPSEPHLDDVAKAKFTDLLERCSGYLEFGSGGSTRLADRLRKQTLTVESDRFFSAVVRRSLGEKNNVEIIYIDIGLTGPWSYPIFDRPTPRRRRRWSRYVGHPFERLEAKGWFPDLVFVDGRFRRACALQTARKALMKGRALNLFVDDYFSEGRHHYHVIENWLGTPERAGRAAIFSIDQERCRMPLEADITDAISDYR